MNGTSDDLTTSQPAALSRRAFMRGVGGGTLSLILSAHGAGAGVLAQGALDRPLPLNRGKRQAVRLSATKGDRLQLPFWGDAANWNRPEYYETIQAGRRPFSKTVQSADIDGDGRDELLVRGLRGIFANRFDPDTGQWTQLPDGPAWDDVGGWDRPMFRQTMQTADINGDGRAELLSLGNPTLYITEYHPESESWQYFPPGPSLDNNGVLEQPQYYQTMQCADIDGDLRPELLIRGADGLRVWKYQVETQTWNQESLFSQLSDAMGWNYSEMYETLQCADVDGDGAAELIGRASNGLYVWKFDPAAKTWSASGFLPASDENGWDKPEFYRSIQCADIDGDGKAELLGIIPAGYATAAGMGVWKYNNGGWTQMPTMTAWALPVSDPRFPTYETVQCADIDGDGHAELLGRVGSGIQCFKYDPIAKSWNQLPDGPAWSDANGWDQVQFYATIQTARVLKPGDPGYTGDTENTQSVLIGRSSRGIESYRYDAATKQWFNTSRPFPQFTGGRLTAYNYLPTLLGIQNAGSAGIRGTYNDQAAPLIVWRETLYTPQPASYDHTPRPHCNQPPPAGVSQAEWDAVTWQIFWELVWVANVQRWFGTLSVAQMNSTFLSQELTLYSVGKYLQYSNDNGWQVALSILGLIAGAMAAGLGFPELEAGAAASVVGILSNAFAAASEFMPGGGGSFETQYNELQSQLADGFNAMITSLGTTQYAITGGIGGSGYVPGDYGLLRAIGQMIESTVWSWPSGNLNLVAAMQRGYAEEVFKVLFTAFQANAGYYGKWMQAEDVNAPYFSPSDYPVQSAVYTAKPPYRWLTYYSNSGSYVPTTSLQAMFDPPRSGTVFPVGISTSEFYQAQNGWPTMYLYDISNANVSNALQKRFPPTSLASLGADLRVSASLSRDLATNQIVATVTVQNMGISGAANVEIVETSLAGKPPLGNPSRQRTHLVQGRSCVYTVRFPSPAKKATAILKVAGRYKGGTFGDSLQLTVP